MGKLRIEYLFNEKWVKNKCPEHSWIFSSQQLYIFEFCMEMAGVAI